MDETMSCPLKDVAAVVKRHTHDVRNALNGMELELTLLDDNAEDPSVRDAVRRLRQAAVEIGRLMQGLSSKYSLETPSAIPAIQIAERWNVDARHVAGNASLLWSIELDSEAVWGEAGLIRSLLKDVLEVAVRISARRQLQIRCRHDTERAHFEISVLDGNLSGSGVESHQAYWTALRGAAERGRIALQPDKLRAEDSFPMVFSLPLHRPPG